MTPLFRLFEPGMEGRKATRPKVHYESEDGRVSLCTQVKVFRVVDGETMRVWYRTRRPVDCKSCVKQLACRARKQLDGLNGEQLENILEHLATFRARYGAVRPASTPALNGKD